MNIDNYMRCINCENHEDYKMACKLKNPNYEKKKIDATTDLTECFIKSKLHDSMDNLIDITNELINKLNKD